MSEMQILTKDWEQKIKAHTEMVGKAQAHLTSLPPDHPEFDARHDAYGSVCQDFVAHIDSFYGSAQGFSDFIRADLGQKFSAVRLSRDDLDEYPNWTFPARLSVRETAEQLSRIYRINYLESVDAVAHHKAFHHAAPAGLEYKL